MSGRTIPEIIAAAGGIRVVSEATGLRYGVEKWPIVGIADKYWPALMQRVPDLTPAELFAANDAVRAARRAGGSRAA